jgi:hypothetical protein
LSLLILLLKHSGGETDLGIGLLYDPSSLDQETLDFFGKAGRAVSTGYAPV